MSTNLNLLDSEMNTLNKEINASQEQYTKASTALHENVVAKHKKLMEELDEHKKKIKQKSNENTAKPKNVNNTLNQTALHRYRTIKFETYPGIELTKKSRLKTKRNQLVEKEPNLESLQNEIASDIIQYFSARAAKGTSFWAPGYILEDIQKFEKKYKILGLENYNTLDEFLNAYAPKTILSRFTRKNVNRKTQAFQAAAQNAYQKLKKLWNTQTPVRNTLNQYERETLLPYLAELKQLYNQHNAKQTEIKKLIANYNTNVNKLVANKNSKINALQKTKKNKKNQMNKASESFDPNEFKPLFEAAGFAYHPPSWHEEERDYGYYQGYGSYKIRVSDPDYFQFDPQRRPYTEGDPIPEGFTKKSKQVYVKTIYHSNPSGYQGYNYNEKVYRTEYYLERVYPANLPQEFNGPVYRNKWYALKKYLQSANRT
jgi:hypothetical protein